MKNKHKILTTLLIVLLCVTMLVSLIACNKPNEGETEEVKDTSEFITNGNYEVTTSDIFPKVPSGWSNSAGSTSSGNETDVDADSLVAGVIDTNEKIYNKEKKAWNKLPNPEAVGADSKILMIYNKKPNSYKYTSNSFSLDAEKYYKIDISVKTVNMTDSSYGAYVKIGGDSFVEFENIKTNNTWQTYSAIIKTSNVSSNSLNVLVSNGKGGKNDGTLSEGYAFFDNVVVTESTEKAYNEFKDQTNANKKVDDLVLGDVNFKNVSGDKNPFTARKWTGVTSSGSDGVSAPTGSDFLEKGIIDFNSKLPANLSADIVKPTGSDQKVLMINNKKETAYGYRSDSKIRITASDSVCYKLSVKVQTKDVNADSIGAYIRLKSSTDKDEQIVTLSNIISEGGWTTASILIKPDTNKNKDIYLQVGLGQGGKNDTEELVLGQAFFDEITLETITADDYNDAVEAEGELAKTSLVAEISDNLIAEGEAYNKDNYVTGNYTNKNDGLDVRGIVADSYMNNDITYLPIKNESATVTRIKYNKPFKIAPNNHYRLSMNVKTEIADNKKGISILLYEVVEKNTTNLKDKELIKIDKFNSATVTKNVLADGSVELTFLIQGDAQKEKEIYFEIAIGSGTNLTPATLVKGNAILSKIQLNKINYSDYNSESGTYVKKHSFRADNGSIKNNDFNLVDISATKTQVDKIANDNTIGISDKFDEEDFLKDNTQGIFGLPLNWTTSTKDQLKNIYAGVYDINNQAQTNKLGIDNAGIPLEIEKNNSNLLAISIPQTGSKQNPWGFTSPSLSLSKGKFYELNVWARLVSGTATINLKSSSKAVVSKFDLVTPSDKLQKYTFYISAGFDDFTAYLELKLGDNSDATLVGTALFDLPEFNEIPEFHYDELVKDINPNNEAVIAFTTTTFDNSTPSEDNESLDTPNNWSGSHEDSDAPSGKNKSVAGVYNRYHGLRNEVFGGVAGENKAPIDVDVLEDILNTAPRLVEKDGEIVEDKTPDLNNDNILVINNNEASEYVYSTTLASNSLAEKKYYEISLFVLTYDVASDKHATISLKLHNSTFEFGKNDKRGINVNTDGEWRRYSFFIQTEEGVNVDSVKLSVALGQKGKDNYVSGYLFVDNVSINEITEARFKTQVPADKFPNEEATEENFQFDKDVSAVSHRIVFSKEDMKKEVEEETTENEKKTDPLLWLYITSGIIGGLIVIVVVIFLLQKFHVFDKLKARKSNFNTKGKETYNRNNVNTNKSSSNSKDINKKHQD